MSSDLDTYKKNRIDENNSIFKKTVSTLYSEVLSKIRIVQNSLKSASFKQNQINSLLNQYNMNVNALKVNLNKSILKEFSVHTTPNTTIIFALRASMSIPGYFTPVVDPETGHYYVDGALLNNYPITLVNDTNILGISFDYSTVYIDKIESIQSYFNQLISCFHNKLEEIPLKFKEKTIYINSTVSTINFFLSQEERVELMEVGRRAVINYLESSSQKITRRNSI